MWRRRGGSVRTASARADTAARDGYGAVPPQPTTARMAGARLPGCLRRGRRRWRMDRRGDARVAWDASGDLSQPAAPNGVIPAPVAWSADGRLGADMPSVYCTACGLENPDGARFCSRCGTPLARLSGERAAETTSTFSLGGGDLAEAEFGDEPVADAATLESLPPGTAILVVRRGPNAGSRFLLDSDLTLAGRHPESDIFLDDVTVSRRHAEFYRQGGRFTVRDVGSHNGTYLNRERIEVAELSGGDEVQVGKFRLVFLVGPRSGAEHGGGGAQVGG